MSTPHLNQALWPPQLAEARASRAAARLAAARARPAVVAPVWLSASRAALRDRSRSAPLSAQSSWAAARASWGAAKDDGHGAHPGCSPTDAALVHVRGQARSPTTVIACLLRLQMHALHTALIDALLPLLPNACKRLKPLTL